jgi:hypothetical protein
MFKAKAVRILWMERLNEEEMMEKQYTYHNYGNEREK